MTLEILELNFIYYVFSTAFAVGIGLLCVLLIQPGNRGGSLELRKNREIEIAQIKKNTTKQEEVSFQKYLALKVALKQARRESSGKKIKGAERSALEMIREDVILKVLSNPFKSLRNTNSLGVIFFSILIGLACLTIGG